MAVFSLVLALASACAKTGNVGSTGSDVDESGQRKTSTTHPEVKKARAMEEELKSLNVQFSASDVFRGGRMYREFVVSMLQRWIDWGDLSSGDLDSMKRARTKLDELAVQAVYVSLLKNVDSDIRKEMELKFQLALQASTFLVKRQEIHNLFLKEKALRDYHITFSDDGRISLAKGYFRSTPLSADLQTKLEEGTMALADYHRLAVNSVSGLDKDKFPIVKVVAARQDTAKRASEFLNKRASAETRKMLLLLSTMSEKGIAIVTTADRSDYVAADAEATISTDEVKTGLKDAKSFSADQLANQDAAIAAMKEFLPLAAKSLEDHKHFSEINSDFVALLKQQRDGVTVANQFILFRRAEVEVITALEEANKVGFEFTHALGATTARVLKPKVADLKAPEKAALVTALERLKKAIELTKSAYAKKQGVRYKYETDGALMDAEISLINDAIADYKR